MPVTRHSYTVPVVRLKKAGTRFELAVHREAMDAYIATGRKQTVPVADLKDLLIDFTVFQNVIRKLDATKDCAFKAFGQNIPPTAEGNLDEPALWLASTLAVLQHGELVEDMNTRRDKRHDEVDATNKLYDMISERVVSKFSGAPLDELEFAQLMDAGKGFQLRKQEQEEKAALRLAKQNAKAEEKAALVAAMEEEGIEIPEGAESDEEEYSDDEEAASERKKPPFKEALLPLHIYKPADSTNLLQWAAHAAHILTLANMDKLRRYTVQAEVAIRADAKPISQLLQKLCRGYPELVILKSKTEYQEYKQRQTKVKFQEPEGEDEAQEECQVTPDVPTFVYSLICDPGFLELEGCRVNADADATLEQAALKGAKVASGAQQALLEFFNCEPSIDPEDLIHFTEHPVPEPSAVVQKEVIPATAAGGAKGESKKHVEDGEVDPYGTDSKRNNKKKGKGKQHDDTDGGGTGGGGNIATLEKQWNEMNVKQLQELVIKVGAGKGGKKKEDLIDLLIAHAEGGGALPSDFAPVVVAEKKKSKKVRSQ